jgi:membrane protease YdiL (CAAX protease family)
MIVLIESSILREFPILKDDNFRMMLNSSILDVLTIAFIINFVLFQHRERLISLGISARNLLRNVFYGIVGYVAAVPALVVTLIVIAAVINVIKYVPEKQPIVELFMKEQDAAFLMYSSLFAALVGPFIEELFFRGFMYAALRKYAGVFGAMALTSAVFAALHTHIVGFLPIMLLGMVLAYLYEKTGTLVAPITVHMMHNFSMVLFVFLLKQLRV